MYLPVGGDTVLRKSQIVGIFEMDNATWAYRTRESLRKAEEDGRVVTLTDDLPRSFILTRDGTVYLSPFSSATLQRRAEETAVI